MRAVLAVIVGYVPMAAAVFVSFHRAVTGTDATLSAGPDLGRLIYDVIAALLGGYLCGWVAGRNEIKHGVVLAVVGVVIGTYFLFISAENVPPWLEFLDLALMVAAVLAGARIRAWVRAQPARTGARSA